MSDGAIRTLERAALAGDLDARATFYRRAPESYVSCGLGLHTYWFTSPGGEHHFGESLFCTSCRNWVRLPWVLHEYDYRAGGWADEHTVDAVT